MDFVFALSFYLCGILGDFLMSKIGQARVVTPVYFSQFSIHIRADIYRTLAFIHNFQLG
jgi:hypothetical protein